MDGESRTLLERAGSAAASIGQAGPSNPRLRTALQWGLAALIFGFLVFFIVRQSSSLPNFDWRFSPGWLVLSAALVIAFYNAQVQLWRLLLRALGSDIPGTQGRAIWGKSLIARYVPTNALMVVGRVVMAEKLGVPKRITLASIVYELGLGLGTALIVGSYFVIQLPDLHDQPARYAILILIPLVLAGFHPRIFGPVSRFALTKLGREPLPSTLPFRRVLQFALAYIACWALVGASLSAFAAAIHPIDTGDLPYIAASYPVAFCVSVLTFIIPSGLGTRDAAVAIGISAVLPSTVATAIAVGFRLFQTAFELLVVGSFVWLDRRRSSRAAGG